MLVGCIIEVDHNNHRNCIFLFEWILIVENIVYEMNNGLQVNKIVWVEHDSLLIINNFNSIFPSKWKELTVTEQLLPIVMLSKSHCDGIFVRIERSQ